MSYKRIYAHQLRVKMEAHVNRPAARRSNAVARDASVETHAIAWRMPAQTAVVVTVALVSMPKAKSFVNVPTVTRANRVKYNRIIAR